jgi:hypothetical protein
LMEILDQMVKIQLAYVHDSTVKGYRKNDGTQPREKVFSKKPHKVSPFFL